MDLETYANDELLAVSVVYVGTSIYFNRYSVVELRSFKLGKTGKNQLHSY